MRVQLRVDDLGVSVEIEPSARLGQQQRQQGLQRLAHLQVQSGAARVELALYPAVQGVPALPQADRAGQGGCAAARRHQLHAVELALGKKGQHRRGVIGRAIGQPQQQARLGGQRCPAAAQARGVQAVVAAEGGVQAALAAKAAQAGHLGHWQRGVGQQLLGAQQAPGLQVLQGRYAQLRLKNTAQVAVADAQPLGQLGHAGRGRAGQWRGIKQLRRLHGQDAGCVLGGPGCSTKQEAVAAGGELGPTAQAGPEASAFSLGRMREKTTVVAARRAHPADRAAVDAGRADAGEETAIKTRVTGQQGAVAGLAVGARGCFDHAGHAGHDTCRLHAGRCCSGRFRTCGSQRVGPYNLQLKITTRQGP